MSIIPKVVDQLAKSFKLADLIKHEKWTQRTIVEVCAQYPSKGVGFKIWKKHWPKNSFYIVNEAKFKDPRHGNLYGTLTWKGQKENSIPLKIKDTLKRGMWSYSIEDSHVKLDNGVEYTSEDMKAFTFPASKKDE